MQNLQEDDEEILNIKIASLASYLDSENSTQISNSIEKDFTESELLNIRFNNDKKTLLIKLVFLESPINNFINILKNKISPSNLKIFINASDDNGISPLLYAVFLGKYDTVICLIENGAKISMRNFMGLSVMHMAAQGDHPNMLIYFKEIYHFSINDRDYAGNTPLHWACHMGSENCINFLICWMDDINVLNKKGQTPFYYGIKILRPKIIKKLLKKGADVYLKDFSGKSVMDILNDPDPEIQQREKNYKHVLRVIHNNEPFILCVYPDNGNQNKKNYKELFSGFKNDELKEKLIDDKNNDNNKDNNKFIEKKESYSFFYRYLNTFIFFGLHIFFESLIYFLLLPELTGYYWYYFFYILLILLIISFVIANRSDPGFLKASDNMTWLEMVQKKIPINKYCPYCRVKKEEKVKHCHICCRCVAAFDHHCNWIDNCVGDNNIFSFLFFVIMILINLIFSFYLGINSLMNTKQEDFLDFKIKGDYILMNSIKTFLNMRWLFQYEIEEIIGILVIIVSGFFFMPVFYVLWIQVRNRILRKFLTE